MNKGLRNIALIEKIWPPKWEFSVSSTMQFMTKEAVDP